MRVIGYGYFLAFLATFLSLLFNVYQNTPMRFFTLHLLFIYLFFLNFALAWNIERHKRLRAIKMIRIYIYI